MAELDVGQQVNLMGVHRSLRIPCTDLDCPYKHYDNRPAIGRYHYEDDERSGMPGVLLGYEAAPWPAQGSRPILKLITGGIATADLEDVEALEGVDAFKEEQAASLYRGDSSLMRDADGKMRVIPKISGGATAPAFAATVGTEVGSVSTANTNRDGTGTIATILTAGASGTKIEEITLKAEDNPADGIVIFFLHDGSTFHMFDEYDTADPADATTTVTAYRETRTYENLIIPTSWSLRALTTVALTAGVFRVFGFAGDF